MNSPSPPPFPLSARLSGVRYRACRHGRARALRHLPRLVRAAYAARVEALQEANWEKQKELILLQNLPRKPAYDAHGKNGVIDEYSMLLKARRAPFSSSVPTTISGSVHDDVINVKRLRGWELASTSEVRWLIVNALLHAELLQLVDVLNL